MNDLDELMSRDPLELSAQDIDAIIAYQRKSRAQWTSGVKPKKETPASQKVDLVELGLVAKPEGIRRRI